MKVATGTSLLQGIAIGKLKVCRREAAEPGRISALTPEEEYARFQAARRTAQEQLSELYRKALGEVGEAFSLYIAPWLLLACVPTSAAPGGKEVYLDFTVDRAFGFILLGTDGSVLFAGAVEQV